MNGHTPANRYMASTDGFMRMAMAKDDYITLRPWWWGGLVYPSYETGAPIVGLRMMSIVPQLEVPGSMGLGTKSKDATMVVACMQGVRWEGPCGRMRMQRRLMPVMRMHQHDFRGKCTSDLYGHFICRLWL